jgi:hypothetical protein
MCLERVVASDLGDVACADGLAAAPGALRLILIS